MKNIASWWSFVANGPRRAARSLAALMLTAVIAQANAQGLPSAAEPPIVKDQVSEAFRWADFDELERLYGIYGRAGARSKLTGAARVGQFWDGIGRFADPDLRVTDEYFLQLESLSERWSREHPQSTLAKLLVAKALTTHAWAYRGNGFARTVSPGAWAGFRDYLTRAEAQLDRVESSTGQDSSWNRLMLEVGRGLGWEWPRLLAVFDKGIAKNPDDDDLYFSMQRALLPKWGGNVEVIDRFITVAVNNTREKRGLEMYARLYAAVAYEDLDQSLFTESRASWPTMKLGFEDRLRRYPHVDHRNMYAYFACMAKDRTALQEQLELIGDKFERAFWGSNADQTFEACKRMAREV